MNAARLVQMANQIAANLAAQGAEKAARETAEHIRSFWDPSMRAAFLKAGPQGLSAIASAAYDQLNRES